MAGLVAWLVSNTNSRAADYRLDAFTVTGGGGVSRGGSFALAGAIGQSDAGNLAGGAFNLEGGFWHGASLVQTPGAPALKIRLLGNGLVVISWPLTVSGYTLEQSSALGTAWSPTQIPVVDTATEHTVTVSASGAMWSYRLQKSQP